MYDHRGQWDLFIHLCDNKDLRKLRHKFYPVSIPSDRLRHYWRSYWRSAMSVLEAGLSLDSEVT